MSIAKFGFPAVVTSPDSSHTRNSSLGCWQYATSLQQTCHQFQGGLGRSGLTLKHSSQGCPKIAYPEVAVSDFPENDGIHLFWRRKMSCSLGIDFREAERGDFKPKISKNTAKWINKREIHQSQTWEQLWWLCPKSCEHQIPDDFRFSREHDGNHQLFEYLPICAQILSWQLL